MFTFSFGSAFAVVPGYTKAVAEANFGAAMDDAKDEGEVVISGYTVEYETLNPYREEILALALLYAEDDEDSTEYVKTYEYIVKLLDGTAFKAEADQKEGLALGTEIVAKQYEADKADALAVLGGLDLSAYSTADMPEKHKGDCTCKTYKEHVQYLIDDAIDEIKNAGKDLTADSTIDKYSDAIAEVEKYIAEYDGEKTYTELVVEKGYVAGKDGDGNDICVGLGIYEVNADYVVDTTTDPDTTLANYETTYVEGQAASDAAGVASTKAAIAQAYATYIKTNTKAADKEYAEDVKKVLDFLADEEVIDNTYDFDSFFDTSAISATDVSDAISVVKTAEIEAAKYAAEKDANGKLVRDAEDVADLVTEATILEYTAAVGVAYTSEYKDANNNPFDTLDDCLVAIMNLYVGLGDAELEFVKAIRAEFVADLLTYCEEEETYYPAELAKVKAITEEYLAKVNAITDIDDIDEYDDDYIGTINGDFADYLVNDIAGKIDDVKTADEVVALAEDLQGAAKQYAKFVNDQISKEANRYYVGKDLSIADPDDMTAAKLNELVADLVGNSGARLSKEIEALSDQAIALVKTLPTYAAVEAAADAVEDAVDELPGTVKIADKALVDAALAAIEAYEELSGEDFVDDGNKVATAVLQLAYAYNNEITTKVKAVSATDKAAVQAILDEIDAFVETYDLSSANEETVFGENQEKLEGYLDKIMYAAYDKVYNAIVKIPVSANLTEAARPAVEEARAAYDAYVAEYTDVEHYDYEAGEAYTIYEDGFAAGHFGGIITDLFSAEVALGLNKAEVNAFDEVAVKAYLQDLSVKARSVKTAKGNVKVTIVADVDVLVENGYTVEYKFYRSTKSSKNYGKAKKVSEENTYTNTSGKKGTKYFYKAVIVAKNAEGEVVAKTPLKHCLYATRTWSK